MQQEALSGEVLERLVYISAAREAHDAHMLEQLLTKARARNEEAGITGFLMYHNEQFFQVIEGPADRLENCFSSIRKDKAHHTLITLMREPCQERVFSDWSMGLVQLKQFPAEIREQFVNLMTLRQAVQHEELMRDRLVSIFAGTFLADIRNLREVLS